MKIRAKTFRVLVASVVLMAVASCASADKTPQMTVPAVVAETQTVKPKVKSANNIKKYEVDAKKIVFSGGSFWCMQPPFDELKPEGVISVVAGFAGGSTPNPTYDLVQSGKSGHSEVVEVTYDANNISLEKILETFWKNVDPFDSEGQFCDKGNQYVSAIFYSSEEQKPIIEQSKVKAQEAASEKSELATKILPYKDFYRADESHQDYYIKNPSKFKYYKFSCGREDRLKKIWQTSK